MNAIDKILVGQAIRHYRELRGWTQANLAAKTGLQLNSLALVERGERGTSLESLSAIAGALEVPPALLVLLGTKRKGGDAATISFVNKLQALADATIDAKQRIKAAKPAGIKVKRGALGTIGALPWAQEAIAVSKRVIGRSAAMKPGKKSKVVNIEIAGDAAAKKRLSARPKRTIAIKKSAPKKKA